MKKFPLCGITHGNFDDGFGIFEFTLTNTDFPKSYPLQKSGNLKLSIAFDVPLPSNVILMIQAKFPAKMTIDQSRNVSFDDL